MYLFLNRILEHQAVDYVLANKQYRTSDDTTLCRSDSSISNHCLLIP